MNVLTSREFRDAVGLFFQLNIWLAVISIVMVGVSALTLSIPLRELGPGLVVPSFLVYFIYIRERRHIPDEDCINHPYRTRLVEKYDRPLHATELAALATYELLLLIELPMRTTAGVASLLLAHLPIVVLYFYSWLKGNPGFDSLAVATAWSYLVVFSVLVTAERPVTIEVVAVFLGWVVIVFAGVESRNLEDAHGDEEIGNDTVATRIGRNETKMLVFGLKSGGVGLFWLLGGPRIAFLVVVYLVLLRVSRTLSKKGKYRTV